MANNVPSTAKLKSYPIKASWKWLGQKNEYERILIYVEFHRSRIQF